ncbi:MAG: hypothetical protein ABIC95_01085 [archaeon]
MIDMGFRSWISLILGLLLTGMTVLPLFGITALSFLSGFSTYIVLAALIFLIIDGFVEEHMLKTVTLFVGLAMAILLAVPLMSATGWIPFSLPTFVLALYPYVMGLGGILLIGGAFFHG